MKSEQIVFMFAHKKLTDTQKVEMIESYAESKCREQRAACVSNIPNFHKVKISCRENEEYVHVSDLSYDIMNTPLVTSKNKDQ